jgi:signal transduction histidine kinase
VDVLQDGALRLLAATHREPDVRAMLAPLRGQATAGPRGAIVERVVRSGEPVLIPEVSQEWIRGMGTDASGLEAMEAVDLRSILIVPLTVHGQVLGALSVGYASGERRFAQADLPLVRALADRAALALQNARLHAAAVRARQVRDDMLGMVSHDLRSPLNAINLNLALMGREVQRPEIAEMKRSVARANRLIQDLLISSMLDAGALPVEVRDEPIPPLVDEVMQLHRAVALESRVALTAHVACELPSVPLDRHRIVQLLSNLVGNAVKFTPAGGGVELRVRCDDEHVVFEVADTGRGIAPDELPRLFDRFWQGAHARRAGAGLGLTIAKGIAVAHGGELLVESALGRGSTFTAMLPLRARTSLAPAR